MAWTEFSAPKLEPRAIKRVVADATEPNRLGALTEGAAALFTARTALPPLVDGLAAAGVRAAHRR
jgi:hypothetical protein